MPAPIRSQIRSKDLLSLADLSPQEFELVLRAAAEHKREPSSRQGTLAGRSVILLFEKDSLRTRCSFEVGVHRLGGHAMYMDHSRQRIGVRESVADYAKNLDRFFGIIVARVYDHETVRGLAEAASVPVINALCNLHHPCQALADFLTIQERAPRVHDAKGDLRRARLCYIGEANNVSNSLLHGAALAGATMTLITPPDHGATPAVLREAELIASHTGATIRTSEDPAAVKDHDAVYTDTWFSMGYAPASDAAHQERLRRFAPYRVDAHLMSLAGPEAIFLHCLPASRGVEVTDEVMDSAHSAIYDEAENRLWAQTALMELLVSGR